jgi:hypothetical protein
LLPWLARVFGVLAALYSLPARFSFQHPMSRDYRHNHLEFFELIRIIAQKKTIDPHWSMGTLLASHARLPRKNCAKSAYSAG